MNPILDELPEYPFVRIVKMRDSTPPETDLKPILLSLGDPLHPLPENINRVMKETLENNPDIWIPYPIVPGTEPFRKAVTGYLKRRFGLTDDMINQEHCVFPSTGSKEATFMLATMALSKGVGDGRPVAITCNPCYPVYEGASRLAGAELVSLPAVPELKFNPDLDSIPQEILERTELFYLCSPSNPHGTTPTMDYMKKLIRLAREYNFILAVDECYIDIYTKDEAPLGIFEAAKAIEEEENPSLQNVTPERVLKNIVVFHTLSKRCSAPGLRSGFVAGDPYLIERFKYMRGYAAADTPNPILAVATELWTDDTYVQENREMYRRKFDLVDEMLGGKYGYYRPDGGYFVWLDVGDGEQAMLDLWREKAVLTVPGAFLSKPDANGVNPSQQYLRLAMVEDLPTIEEGLNRVLEILESKNYKPAFEQAA